MTAAARAAIVTGAGRGIGLAIVRTLRNAGIAVLGVDLETDGLAGTGAAALALDVTDDDAPRRIVEAAVALFGGFDYLVNNAGVGGSRALTSSDDALIQRILSVNLVAPMRLTREAIPALRRPGAVVNVSPSTARRGFPGRQPTPPPRARSRSSRASSSPTTAGRACGSTRWRRA